MELKPLVCQQCGGTIDRKTMKCPYCDTQYEQKNDGISMRYVVETPGIHTIRAMVAVDDRMAIQSPQAATKFTMDKMRDKIAEGLLDYLKITTERDPLHMCQIIRGEIRVVDPTFSTY